ncbi:MAG: PorP/SprF family type IX secretion system membrane protein [Bacteroidota bacterium]
MRKSFSVILILLFCKGFLIAQDVHFSQINNTPLILNPSLAGFVTGDTRTILNYKEQWRSITVPYQTIAASFDMPLFKKKWRTDYIGIGASLYSDKAGDAGMGTTSFNFSLSYSRTLRNSANILFGMQTSYGQRNCDITKLSWDNQYNGSSYDPTLPSNEPFTFNNNFSYFDLGAGAAWTTAPTRYFKSLLGVSLFHITQPKLYYYETSDERLYSKLVVHGSINFTKRHTNMTYIPSFIYFRQGPQQELTFGSLFRYRLREASKYTGYYEEKAICFGVWYRFNDAVIPCIRYEFDGKYFIEVSYDTNVSELTNASHARGGFEISLIFITHGKNKRDLAKPKFR